MGTGSDRVVITLRVMGLVFPHAEREDYLGAPP